MNLDKLKNDFASILDDLGYSLYDLKMIQQKKDRILQVAIDHIDGIDIDDCVKVSDALSLYLDEADPIPDDYMLEVTSPGAERELRTREEIMRFIGHYVHVKTLDQVHEGVLHSLLEDTITLSIKNKHIHINYIDVILIRLAIKF